MEGGERGGGEGEREEGGRSHVRPTQCGTEWDNNQLCLSMCVCLHYVMLLWNTVLCTPCTHVCTYMYVETLVRTILFTAVTSFLLSGCRANIQTKCINKVIFKLVVSERLHNELSCVGLVHVHTSFQCRRICVVHTYVRMYVVSSLFSPLLFLCGVLRENWYEHDRVFVENPLLYHNMKLLCRCVQWFPTVTASLSTPHHLPGKFWHVHQVCLMWCA